MSTNKYVQVLNLLVEQTNDHMIDWTETGDESEFLVSFPNYSILIKEEMGSRDFPYYVVSIVNSEGRIIDRFSDVMLDSEGVTPSSYEIMRNLYNQARRSALRTDNALDEIIAQLGGDPGR
jgi:hypothetical protein